MAAGSLGASSGTFAPTVVAKRLEEAVEYGMDGVEALPLQLVPENEDAASVEGLLGYLESHRDMVLSAAESHGAVLFRGFGVSSAEEFAAVVDGLGIGSMPYVGGAAVRTELVDGKVFTANESPPSEPIPFHHELAQTPEPPTHICFYCEVAAAVGGATPLVSSAAVYEYAASEFPAVLEKFEREGVRYVRYLPEEDDASSAIGRSWKSTYGASTKEEAEAVMREQGTEWEWMEGGVVKTMTRVLPATKVDPRSGRKLFFNQILAAFEGWVDVRNDPTKAVVYGDGGEVDAEALQAIAKWAKEHAASVPWEAGDVIVVDNWSAMHSRQPFEGKRRVLAAVGRGVLPSAERAASLVASTPTVTLKPTGDTMPIVGVGFWKVPRNVTAATVVNAIRVGYRHFDLAQVYGNEKEVGVGLQRALKDGWIKSRKEIFLTSKLWSCYHHPDHVEPALRRILQDLQTDFLDLFLIHFPIASRYVPIEARYPPPDWKDDVGDGPPTFEPVLVSQRDTYAAMEACVDAGLTRNIGLSNFNAQGVREILCSARIHPSVLQIELHPFLQQDLLVRMCASHDIAVVAYSPLGASSYVPIAMAKPEDSALTHPTITAIASKHSKSAAQVVLRWATQRGTIPVVKSTKTHRLEENLDSTSFTLDEEDLAAIKSLDKGLRFNAAAPSVLGHLWPIFE